MRKLVASPFYFLAIGFALLAISVHWLGVFWLKELARLCGRIGDWVSK